ncbi:MAG: S-layer homology domain-containing protein [Potamolinea sp.]
MTNLPSPDPRSSRLGFDEFVAVVVAFTVIGTIFFVSLRQKDKPLNLSLSPNATVKSTPQVGLSTDNSENQQSPPEADAIAPGTNPEQPSIPAIPEKVSGKTALSCCTTSSGISRPLRTYLYTPVQKINFKDVPQVFWARPYIEALTERGVINGFPDGTFRPNQPVTRAEFAAQLQKAFDHKVVVTAPNFKDVPTKFWASAAIQETARSGFLRGVSWEYIST